MYVLGLFVQQSPSASLSAPTFWVGSVLCSSVDLTAQMPGLSQEPHCCQYAGWHTRQWIPTRKSKLRGSEFCASLTDVSETLGKQGLLCHQLYTSVFLFLFFVYFFTIGPCWLSILNIVACTCQSQTPNLFLPPTLPTRHHKLPPSTEKEASPNHQVSRDP